jgi:dolichol-phosphate mannosyltransferase
MAKKNVFLLIPAFNEAGNIAALVQEITTTLGTCSRYEFTVLFVDDGSTDNTLSVLRQSASSDFPIQVIELSRNFGKEMALTAGLQSLNCDAVIILDSDLQHPPKYIPQLLEKWEEGYDIVSTIRSKIDDQSLPRRIGSQLFYSILNTISEFKMEPGTTDFRLLDRVVIEALKKFTERNRLFRGLIDWMGFKKTTIEFEAPSRRFGEPRYSYSRLLRLALNGFMSFSLMPLKLAGYLGVSVILIFGGLLTFMLIDKFGSNFFGFSNIAFIIVSNVIMNGVVLGCIGLVALYIGHIHTEVIGRPLYLIQNEYVLRGNKNEL